MLIVRWIPTAFMAVLVFALSVLLGWLTRDFAIQPSVAVLLWIFLAVTALVAAIVIGLKELHTALFDQDGW